MMDVNSTDMNAKLKEDQVDTASRETFISSEAIREVAMEE